MITSLDPDTDADFQRDRIDCSRIHTEAAVKAHLAMLKVPPDGCAKCWTEVYSILRAYEPS